ncbi:ANT(4')-I family aminoglycoside nucleotidyltransferase [Paenibacillus sp. GCM10023250]|uniref:ANT(4')-I family aminoglycoside nucleotidyltransferase n=1 Tax=Paenibacillus sp. GCM10023250 TaxID=3252648 RepID=UPI003621DF72
MHTNGPLAITRNERLQICRELASRLHEVYGDQLLAVGVYGSVSRGTDSPFSDIEMFGVLHDSGEDVDLSYEWSAGPWKAEVDVRSASVLLASAARVEGRWPLTHGPFFSPLSLYDPHGFFPRLREAAQSPRQEAFKRAIEEVLVGEMYEYAGKLRNAHHIGSHAYLPYLAMEFAHYGAMLIGLHHRRLFTTGALVLSEALELPERPEGFDRVARLAMSGELNDPAAVVNACEAFWDGLVQWAAAHDYTIHSTRIPF